MTDFVTTLAIFFGKTEGRDKFAKGIQNYCRYKKHYASGESKEMFKGLQDSLVWRTILNRALFLMDWIV
jgi:hypothetical protein